MLDGVATALTGPALQTKFSQKWTISLMNLTYLFVYLVSVTFSSLLQQLASENLNPARNLNLGWLHTCKPKFSLEIASVGQYIKLDRSGLMLVMKPPRLSTRSRKKVGKIFFKMLCRIQLAQACGKSFKVWTVLLMPTLLLKQCPTAVKPSLISNPKFTSSWIIMPGSANPTCQSDHDINQQFKKRLCTICWRWKPCLTSNGWISICHQKKRKVKEQLALTTFHLYFSNHSVLWPFKNDYPDSTHPCHLLTAHVSGGLPQSFHY